MCNSEITEDGLKNPKDKLTGKEIAIGVHYSVVNDKTSSSPDILLV